MNELLLAFLIAGAIFSGVCALWLFMACALAHWRGRQIERLLREMEGREFPPPDERHNLETSR